MRNTIIIALISLVIFGCGKDKFSSTPQIKFKSVSTTELQAEQSIQFKLSFTDAEGDLQDSIYVEKIAFNCPAGGFKSYFKLPEFPSVKNSEGDIIVSYTNGFTGPYPPIGDPQCGQNDTCVFRFMLQDEAKHKSDTITSDVIVIYQ